MFALHSLSGKCRYGLIVISACLLAAALLPGTAHADSTFVVDSADDDSDASPGDGDCDNGSGDCTLRAAIQEANALTGADTIQFAIGTGAVTVSPATALPAITEAVTIDGTTQPGWSGAPIVEIDGSSAGAADGLAIQAGSCTIEGLAITDFSGAGIRVTGVSGAVILSSYIGLHLDGSTPGGNLASGIILQDNADSNSIGGTGAGEGNVISANGTFSPTPPYPPSTGGGIAIVGGSDGNTVQGNLIGTDATGSLDRGNANYGIHIEDSDSNLIGGTSEAARNVISANGEAFFAEEGGAIGGGVEIHLGATGNVVQGNYIGTNAAGDAALGNGFFGVEIWRARHNTIGGAAAGAGNLISGNGTEAGPPPPHAGILLWDWDNNDGDTNDIIGNWIGVNAAGDAALPNSWHGIFVGTSDNTIQGNLISGNDVAGVWLGGQDNVLTGNWIGTDAAGTGSLRNEDTGIEVSGSYNLIGGDSADERNVISGNGWFSPDPKNTPPSGGGIRLNPGVTGTVITGNYIGLNAAGTGAVGNALYGIQLDNADGNAIGGTGAGEGNVISGNGSLFLGPPELAYAQGYGLTLINGSSDNTVQGNLVGLDAAGATGVPNGLRGIEIGNSPNNLVGGDAPGARNVISGNSGDGPPPPRVGILVYGSGSAGTQIIGNYIGTDVTGLVAIPNVYHGVHIGSRSGDITTDITVRGNLISGNTNGGIWVNGASDITIEDNTIGLDANGNPLGNGSPLKANGGIYVADYDPSSGVTITGNRIAHNNGLGIDLNPQGVTANDTDDSDTGANDLQNYPVLAAAHPGASGVTVSGSLNSTANTTFRVEFFANTACDPSGYGEGEVYLGYRNVTTDAGGDASFSAAFPTAVPPGDWITATATNPAGSTSEFSACVEVTENTPAGLAVTAEVIDQTSGEQILDITFDQVDTTGNTTLQTSGAGNPPPEGFLLGDPPTYFDINTTAAFTGSITVCIDYGGIDFGGLDPILFHYETGTWADITTSVDPINQVVCGEVTSLSPFSLFIDAPPGPAASKPEDGYIKHKVKKLGWDKYEDALRYEVQIASDPGFNNIERTELAIKNKLTLYPPLDFGTHYWRVRAEFAPGFWTDWSSPSSFTITPLKTPEDGEILNDGEVKFKWKKIPEAVSYTLQIATDADFSENLTEYPDLTSTSYTPAPLADDTYYWRVRGVGGSPANWSPAWVVTIDAP